MTLELHYLTIFFCSNLVIQMAIILLSIDQHFVKVYFDFYALMALQCEKGKGSIHISCMVL